MTKDYEYKKLKSLGFVKNKEQFDKIYFILERKYNKESKKGLSRQFFEDFLINKEGYNKYLIHQLNNKEIYRIFILSLAFNSTILK